MPRKDLWTEQAYLVPEGIQLAADGLTRVKPDAGFEVLASTTALAGFPSHFPCLPALTVLSSELNVRKEWRSAPSVSLELNWKLKAHPLPC